MQQFNVPVYGTDGNKHRWPIYIGEAIEGVHPLEQQAAFLQRERGLTIAQEVMDSFAKLAAIALENNVSYEELCEYAMNESEDGEPDAAAAADGEGGPEEDDE